MGKDSMQDAEQHSAWEYKLVPMGNPLEPGVEERANAFGKQGWDLVAIDAGIWVFKRPGHDEVAGEESLRALMEQTVPLNNDLTEAIASESPASAVPLEPSAPAHP
jgi:hypothetical protein